MSKRKIQFHLEVPNDQSPDHEQLKGAKKAIYDFLWKKVFDEAANEKVKP